MAVCVLDAAGDQEMLRNPEGENICSEPRDPNWVITAQDGGLGSAARAEPRLAWGLGADG